MYSISSSLNKKRRPAATQAKPLDPFLLQMLVMGLCEPATRQQRIILRWKESLSQYLSIQFRVLQLGKGQWLKNLSASPTLLGAGAETHSIAVNQSMVTTIAQQIAVSGIEDELSVIKTSPESTQDIEVAGLVTLTLPGSLGGPGALMEATMDAIATQWTQLMDRHYSTTSLSKMELTYSDPLRTLSPLQKDQSVAISPFILRFPSDVSPDAAMDCLTEALKQVSSSGNPKLKGAALVINPALAYTK
jgi:hypothetical protein